MMRLKWLSARILPVFLFLLPFFLAAQSGDTVQASVSVPSIRAIQVDVGKFLLALDLELNLDVDLYRIGNSWFGLRWAAVNTGYDSFCSEGRTDCLPSKQYYHTDLLAYLSWISTNPLLQAAPLRFSLLAGASNVSDRIELTRESMRLKFGWEVQVRLARHITVGVGHYGIPGYAEGLTGYVPLELNFGYARW